MIRIQHVLRVLTLIASLWCGALASAGDLIYFNEMGGSGGSPRQLYKFNPVTGSSTLLSTISVPERIYAMTRHPATGVLYGVAPLTNSLYTINENTGATTLVATLNVFSMTAITFDPTTNVLYGISQYGPVSLYTIDYATGICNVVGAVPQLRRALACSSTGQLYYMSFTGVLYTLDKATAVSGTIGGGGGGISLVSDLNFTPDGKLYASDYDGSLHEIDINTGAETPVGTTGLGGGLLGLADAAGCVTSTYCTGKVNALGCTPTIGSVGTPSSSVGSGFVVNCTQVRNLKNGLLFYGVNGGASAPYQGGTLCVKAQIKRTGSQNSGGSPPPANDCSGVWSIDMNAFAVSAGPPTPLPALTIPGTTVNCQWWGRDPGYAAPNNTQLSNGLQYLICN